MNGSLINNDTSEQLNDITSFKIDFTAYNRNLTILDLTNKEVFFPGNKKSAVVMQSRCDGPTQPPATLLLSHLNRSFLPHAHKMAAVGLAYHSHIPGRKKKKKERQKLSLFTRKATASPEAPSNKFKLIPY